MAYNLIGKNFVPVDVAAKVTGRAKYAEDFRADGMVFAKTLTSPIPHARIRRIDTSAALKIKGVVGICDKMLSELKATHRHPPPIKEMTVPDMFRRFGADEWDALRERFRSPIRNAAE